MSDWLGVLAQRREEIHHDDARGGEPPKSEEWVLAQVIYEAITAFVEKYEVELCEPDWDLDEWLAEWVEARGLESAQ